MFVDNKGKEFILLCYAIDAVWWTDSDVSQERVGADAYEASAPNSEDRNLASRAITKSHTKKEGLYTLKFWETCRSCYALFPVLLYHWPAS
jgi:hypothetical protein